MGLSRGCRAVYIRPRASFRIGPWWARKPPAPHVLLLNRRLSNDALSRGVQTTVALGHGAAGQRPRLHKQIFYKQIVYIFDA